MPSEDRAGNLHELATPALILDLDRLEANCGRMTARASELRVRLRPHLKTAKSLDVAHIAAGPGGGLTVSTLSEAEYFASAGFRDLTYAVGIVLNKVPIIAAIQRRFGARINLLTDNIDAALGLAELARLIDEKFDVFIEIDCGGGRGGVSHDSDDLIAVGRAIAVAPMLSLAGVLTHAGQSYHAETISEIRRIAERERECAVTAAERLRAIDIDVPCVSVGSTPTALCATHYEGVDEIRPGVYTLFDLDQVQLGVCSVEDIALSVLATVIGHNHRSQRLLIDAGALALSKDLSAAKHTAGIGYGLVCDTSGRLLDGLSVADVHQEHGFVAGSQPFELLSQRYPPGFQFRILPNHACMTAAPYSRFELVRGRDSLLLGHWEKVAGWSIERERKC